MYTPSSRIHIASVLAAVRLAVKVKQPMALRIATVAVPVINYAASKSGMVGFTKSLAQELASRNICVNGIAPGFIQTRMTDVLSETQNLF